MKQLNKFLILFFSVFALSGCAFHMGVVDGSTAITDGNFTVVETAFGFSRSTHFLGIGGLGHTGMTHEARQDMLRRFPLQSGEAYANITTDYKRSFFPLVGTTMCYVTADKVRFMENLLGPLESSRPESSRIIFQKNDNVMVYNFRTNQMRKANIVSYADGISVMYDDLSMGSVQRYSITSSVVFQENTPEYYTGEIKVGSTVEGIVSGKNYSVVGLSERLFLGRGEDGGIHLLDYDTHKVKNGTAQ